MLFRSICLIGVLSVAAGAADTITLKGVIIDTNSAPEAKVRVLSTGIEGGMVVAQAHEKTALLKPGAVRGYGIYTHDDMFYAFDTEGNEKALAAIRASKKLDDFEGEVTGEISGDTIRVKTLRLDNN